LIKIKEKSANNQEPTVTRSTSPHHHLLLLLLVAIKTGVKRRNWNFSETKQTPGVFIHFIDLIITEETRTRKKEHTKRSM